MNPDEEDSAPPSPPSTFRPSIQSHRNPRIGRRSRLERRTPGSPHDEPAADASFPDDPFPEALTNDALTPVAAHDEADSSPRELESGEGFRAAAYRPPARSLDVAWGQSASAAGSTEGFAEVPSGESPGVGPARPPRVFTPDNGFMRQARLRFIVLLGGGLLAAGALGYGLGWAARSADVQQSLARRPTFLPPVTDAALLPLMGSLPAEVLNAATADIDAAFKALKEGRFDESRAHLQTAQERRPAPAPLLGGGISGLQAIGPVAPGGWPSLEVERARTFFYAGNPGAADGPLDAHLRSLPADALGARADALLLRALVQGALRNPGFADQCFAAAASADPARADIFFFWGNAARNAGKPVEAAARFRSALLRNQFETAEGLYRLKLWLCLLQIDDASAAEASAAIDAALSPTPPGEPTGYAFLGAAGRALRASDYAGAANFLARARARLEPVILRVALSDPTFLQENWRPELAGFFR